MMFSVVVPVWNAGATLRGCVERVLVQTFPDFELILVDDGSTDGGVDAITELCDPRLRIVRQPNAGGAAARNNGLALASAEWIAFLDADDVWLPCHLEELDRIRRRHPDAGLIGTRFLHSDAKGRFVLPDDSAGEIALIPFFARYADGEAPLWISSSAVSRKAWQAAGGFRPSRNGEDAEFLVRVALDFPVAASSRATAVWIHGTGGITDRSRERWKNAALDSAADIAPAVATVLSRRAQAGAQRMPPGVSAFVDRYVHWCLAASFEIGDVATMRRLGRLYEGVPEKRDRLLLALAWLPAPLFQLAAIAAAGLAYLLLRDKDRNDSPE